MLSNCCSYLLKMQLEKLRIDYSSIDRGEVIIDEDTTQDKIDLLKKVLHNYKLEIIEDKETFLIEKIKQIVYEDVRDISNSKNQNFSMVLSDRLNYSYSYLSNLFSSVTGQSIKQYMIEVRVEFIKELIVENKYNIMEMTYLLDFSNIAHLSNQFKRITGISPSEFRKIQFEKS